MKVCFVAPTPPDVAAFGIRSLSAWVKKKGHESRVILLPGGVEKYKYGSADGYLYTDQILQQIKDLCGGYDLICLSFMSNYLDRATQLCTFLKSAVKSPLVIGGIHPTVLPESCVDLADAVCIGEGEEALIDILDCMREGRDYCHVENLMLRRDGEIIKNPLRPLIDDLDVFPTYDYGPEEHYIYDNVTDCIQPLTGELLKRAFPMEPHVEGSFSDAYRRTRSYKTMTTRGCPHHCTFCAEKTLGDMYRCLGQRYLRKRSIPHIIGELEWAKRELPFIESIFLFDDTFLVRPTKEIVEFSRIYKEKIGLPIHIQASPTTLNPEKIEALIDAGLAFVEMGIQSMSERGMELYKRNVSPERILKAADVLQQFKGRIYQPCYHVILDNPWERDEDVLETLRLVLKLPRPFWLKRASLVCFPGTELYQKAIEDGLLKEEEDFRREIYNKHLHQPKGTYVNFLMYLAGFCYFPRWIIRLLATRPMMKLLNRKTLGGFYLWCNRVGDKMIVYYKGLRSLLRGDFGRIRNYFIRQSSGMS